MACEFSLNFKQEASQLIAKANAAMRNAGGTFDGDENAGMFGLKTPLGEVAGNYTIQEKTITIVIGKKPMLLSCNLVKTELTKHLAE